MPVAIYSKEIRTRAPDRFCLVEKICWVTGYDADRQRYVLNDKSWIERYRIVLLMRDSNVVAEGKAEDLQPRAGDVIVVPSGEISLLKANHRDGEGIELVDGMSYPAFPENGALVRGKNSEKEVFLATGRYLEYCQRLIEAASGMK